MLRDAFLKANELLETRHPAWADAGGTTACVVLMVGSELTVANCGDTRCAHNALFIGSRLLLSSPVIARV